MSGDLKKCKSTKDARNRVHSMLKDAFGDAWVARKMRALVYAVENVSHLVRLVQGGTNAQLCLPLLYSKTLALRELLSIADKPDNDFDTPLSAIMASHICNQCSRFTGPARVIVFARAYDLLEPSSRLCLPEKFAELRKMASSLRIKSPRVNEVLAELTALSAKHKKESALSALSKLINTIALDNTWLDRMDQLEKDLEHGQVVRKDELVRRGRDLMESGLWVRYSPEQSPQNPQKGKPVGTSDFVTPDIIPKISPPQNKAKNPSKLTHRAVSRVQPNASGKRKTRRSLDVDFSKMETLPVQKAKSLLNDSNQKHAEETSESAEEYLERKTTRLRRAQKRKEVLDESEANIISGSDKIQHARNQKETEVESGDGDDGGREDSRRLNSERKARHASSESDVDDDANVVRGGRARRSPWRAQNAGKDHDSSNRDDVDEIVKTDAVAERITTKKPGRIQRQRKRRIVQVEEGCISPGIMYGRGSHTKRKRSGSFYRGADFSKRSRQTVEAPSGTRSPTEYQRVLLSLYADYEGDDSIVKEMENLL